VHLQQKAKKALAAVLAAGLVMARAGYGLLAGPQGERDITLIVDGRTACIRTTAQTLGEALRDAGISLGPHDKIFPDPDVPVTDGMKARVTRIEVREVTVNEQIARQTVRKASPSLRPGHSRISDPGQDGLQKVTYRLTFADGRRVMKERLASQVIRPARPRIVLYGKGSPLPSRGFFSRKVLMMTATAYDPGPRSCGPYANGRTSTGLKAGKGVVAVDPRVIPLGTKLYIEGYGFAVAGDTGSAIKGAKIDLGHDSYAAALRFGRRPVVVHIIDD